MLKIIFVEVKIAREESPITKIILPSTLFGVVHVRGRRRPRYYRMHSLQFGEWRREWSELITDRKITRELRSSVPIIRSDKTPVPSSPVNQHFDELIRYFASDVPKSEQALPIGISANDWEFNLRRAGRIFERKHAGPWFTEHLGVGLVYVTLAELF